MALLHLCNPHPASLLAPILPSPPPPLAAAAPVPRQLHALSIKTSTFALPTTSSKLISLYADPKSNNLDYACSVFERVPQPTLFSWNVIIKSHVENHRSHDAISLFCELLREFTPDSFTLPCVIKGCARLGAVEEGRHLHGLGVKIGLSSDKFVQRSLLVCLRSVMTSGRPGKCAIWNSLIDGYARCAEVEHALEVFNGMSERDCFSWTALIDGFSKCGEVSTAREMFDRMPNRNPM